MNVDLSIRIIAHAEREGDEDFVLSEATTDAIVEALAFAGGVVVDEIAVDYFPEEDESR